MKSRPRPGTRSGVSTQGIGRPEPLPGSRPLPAVLTVDDEPSTNKLLGDALRHWGYPFYSAENPGEALRILVRRPEIQIVLCDIQMPEARGVTVLRAIKSKRPEVEVIMMTGYPTIATAVEALKYGAYDYLSKPLILDELHHY